MFYLAENCVLVLKCVVSESKPEYQFLSGADSEREGRRSA